MISAIVCLVFISIMVMFNCARVVLKSLRVAPTAMMVVIMIAVIATIIPDYTGEKMIINYLSIWILTFSVWLVIARIRPRRYMINIIAIMALTGAALLYKWLTRDIAESTYYNILYILVVTVGGYLISSSVAEIIVNLSFSMAITSIATGLIPSMAGGYPIVAGSGTLVIIAITIAVLIFQVVEVVSHIVANRKSQLSAMEASEDAFDYQESVEKYKEDEKERNDDAESRDFEGFDI